MMHWYHRIWSLETTYLGFTWLIMAGTCWLDMIRTCTSKKVTFFSMLVATAKSRTCPMTPTLIGISDHMQIYAAWLRMTISGIDGWLPRHFDKDGSIVNSNRIYVLCHCAFKSCQLPPWLDHPAENSLEDEWKVWRNPHDEYTIFVWLWDRSIKDLE